MMSMICLEVSVRPVNGKTITPFHFVIVFSHLPSVKRTHTKKQSTNEMSAVSVVGISAERKSSLWLSWLNNSHEQDAKDLSVVYVIPSGFPFMSSATLPWQRHHAQGSFHTSRKPLAFLRSPDPCEDQVLLITWSSECFTRCSLCCHNGRCVLYTPSVS